MKRALLNGLEGEGQIIIRRTPGGSVAVAAGRWHSDEADVDKLKGLKAAIEDGQPVSYEGPVGDPDFPGVAEGTELEVTIVTTQQEKGLEGGVTGLTCILDPVLPLPYETHGFTEQDREETED
jgi:hypothetical protein